MKTLEFINNFNNFFSNTEGFSITSFDYMPGDNWPSIRNYVIDKIVKENKTSIIQLKETENDDRFDINIIKRQLNEIETEFVEFWLEYLFPVEIDFEKSYSEKIGSIQIDF